MASVVIPDPPSWHTGQFVVVALREKAGDTDAGGTGRPLPTVPDVAASQDVPAGETAGRRRVGSDR
jgi:hypothetical protein